MWFKYSKRYFLLAEKLTNGALVTPTSALICIILFWYPRKYHLLFPWWHSTDLCLKGFVIKFGCAVESVMPRDSKWCWCYACHICQRHYLSSYDFTVFRTEQNIEHVENSLYHAFYMWTCVPAEGIMQSHPTYIHRYLKNVLNENGTHRAAYKINEDRNTYSTYARCVR